MGTDLGLSMYKRQTSLLFHDRKGWRKYSTISISSSKWSSAPVVYSTGLHIGQPVSIWSSHWSPSLTPPSGWHINIMNYRTKLYSIMLEMHEVFTSVHLANRAYVCHYLNHINFRRIEGLLRSTKPLPSDARITDGVNISLAIVSPTRSTLLCEGQFDPRQETMGKVATMKMMVRLTAVSAAFIKAMSIATTVLTTKNRDIFTSQRSLPISFASGTSSMGLPLILLGLSLKKGGRLR